VAHPATTICHLDVVEKLKRKLKMVNHIQKKKGYIQYNPILIVSTLIRIRRG
jgi:hypothetical protein